MKNIFYISASIVLFLLPQLVFSQIEEDGEPGGKPSGGLGIEREKADSIPLHITTWHIDKMNKADTVKVDTSVNGFFLYRPMEEFYTVASQLGNLGLPCMSNIYSERQQFETGFFFMQPFALYAKLPENINFYNTTRPFTRLGATLNANKELEEITLHVLHTQNVNPFFNIGLKYDHISSEGIYKNQKTKCHSLSAFTSYSRKRYELHTAYIFNKFKIGENGGFKGDSTDQDNEFIPVHLENGFTTLSNNRFFVVQQFNFGKQPVRASTADSTLSTDSLYAPLRLDSLPVDTAAINDSLLTDTSGVEKKTVSDSLISKHYVPRFGVLHRLEYAGATRIYQDEFSLSEFATNPFYKNAFYDSTATYDSVAVKSLKNSIECRIIENPLRNISLGMSFFLSHEWRQIYNQKHFILNRNDTSYSNLSLSAMLYRFAGKKWKWNAMATYTFSGYNTGDYALRGRLSKQFHGKNDTTNITIKAGTTWQRPDYFLEQYHSNHFQWNNSFDKEFRLFGKLEFNKPKWRLRTGLHYYNLKNYVYLDTLALPAQETGIITLASAFMEKNLVAGKFHFNNKAVYQTVSNSTVMPLPEFTFTNTTYFQHAFFKKVLFIQAGFRLTYYSTFKAYAFMPATDCFYLQNNTETGNYPMLDVFINGKVRVVHFFIRYRHLSALLNEKKKFYPVYQYPYIDPDIRFGVAWRFKD